MLCLIGFDDDQVIKDFIRIHAEELSGPKLFLSGAYPDYQFNGLNIRKQFEQPVWLRRLVSLLPYCYVSRRQLRMRSCDRAVRAALKRFFRCHAVDAILAEFGDTGAGIAPVAEEVNVPLIVHFHGHDAHRRSFLDEQMLGQYAFMFNCASAVLAVSRYMHGKLVELGCPPEKLIYNPYGPREKFFAVQPDYQPIVLSVGRFTDIKANYLVLMAFRKALQQVPDARLVMAGAGELLEACRTLARVWQIDHAVEFPGPVAHARVHKLFANACCFAQHSVIPSYGDAEGTPNTILEASAAALPVIATRHAGIPDVVVDGKTGFLVAERDVAGMADAMVRALQSPELCRQLGQAARDRIRTHFSVERHVGVLNDVIRYARDRDHRSIRTLAEASLAER
jgi:colanic acid/amylovoran biosynthesis glycosyltransferase